MSAEPTGGHQQAAAPAAGAAGVPRVFGDYELLVELGRGGMGVVYKARQRRVQRTVALKCLLPGALPGPQELARFQTEVEAAAALLHPHIVRVHEVGAVDGCPFYTMDCIEGQSLAQRLRDGPLPGRVAARCLLAVARAIQHAHEHGILHRDLKPENVLLDTAGEPFITDFGLAKRLDAADARTRTGAHLGTPGYMAPEQAAASKQLTPAVDVYGLGALLYALLTGRPPFLAATPFETMVQVLEREPAPPRLLNPAVERDLETICLHCLNKDPARRYESAAALAADLEHVLAGDTISVRSVNLLDRVTSALQRSQYDVQFRPFANLLFAIAAVVLLTETVVNLGLLYDWPIGVVPVAQFTRFGLFAWLLWRFRPTGLLPSTPAERLMWSIWIGYISCNCVIGLAYRLRVGWDMPPEAYLYPLFAAIAGLTFIVLGSSYWGGCYLFAVVFYALPFLMNLDVRWSPLEFGVTWAAVLVVIGVRLRRLSAAEARPGPTPPAASTAGATVDYQPSQE